MIPFGPWLPDQPDYRDAPSLIEARNVVPRPDGSYGPLNSISPVSAVLPQRALGIATARALAGGYSIFAGTAQHLYKLQDTGTWLQVSKSGGYSLATSEFERPEFCQFGDYLVAVMGHGDPTQVFNIGGGSQFSDLSATAPRAKHVAVVRDFVMMGNTWDGSQGARPDQVWWSGIGDHASWPTPGSDAAVAVQSDRQVLADSGHIQGIVPGIGGRDCAIFGEQRIWTATYAGSPVVFSFDPIEGARGCYAAGSIVPVGAVAYYLANDGLYACDGAQSVPIGRGKVDQWLLADLDDSYRDYMYGAYDTVSGLVFWVYPGAGHSAGVPNRMLVFEPTTGWFSRGTVECDLIGACFTVGYSLDGLDALGYSLDTLPFSLDSRVWAGGAPFIGVVDSITHRLGTFTTSPQQADLTTNEFSGPNGSRFWLDGLRVHSDCAAVSAAISWRDTGAGTLTDTSYRAQEDDFIDHLVAARYGRVKTRFPAGAAWSKAQGYVARTRAEGLR